MAGRSRLIAAVVLVLTICVSLPAHAATVTFNWFGCDQIIWCPGIETHRFKQAAAGDTIQWTWVGNHNVEFYAGDITAGNGSNVAHGPSSATGEFLFLKAPFKKSFSGGTVFFFCSRGSNALLSPDGLMCSGMCGGYTSRTTAPEAPIVTNYAEGDSVPRAFHLEGTAEPLVDIHITTSTGTATFAATRTDKFGRWRTAWRLWGVEGHYEVKITAKDILGRSSPEVTLGLNLVHTGAANQAGAVQIADGSQIVSSGDRLHVEGTATNPLGGIDVYVKVWDSKGERLRTYLADCPTCSSTATTAAWSLDIPTGVMAGDLPPGFYTLEALYPWQTSGERVLAAVVSAEGADRAQAPVFL